MKFIPVIWWFIPVMCFAQSSGFHDDFNDNQLASHWWFGDPAYSGSEEEGVLQVNYNRTSSSGAWEQFHLNLPDLDVSSQPYITLSIRSDIQFNLAIKPENRLAQSDWLEQSIPGDGVWHELFFEVFSATTELNKVFFYFDGGTNLVKSGAIQIDDLRLGDAVQMPVQTAVLEEALFDANQLFMFSSEGSGTGQFPDGSKTILQQAIDEAQYVLDHPELIADQEQVDSVVNYLYDQCTSFEIQVQHEFQHTTTDPGLIFGAHNLYSNLRALKGPRFLYGMHDATGYGVGWSGDDDRSDVEDVTGSLPAFFSWELNHFTRKRSIDRFTYRIENVHRMGGVNSLVWHQYDPDGKGFYVTDVDSPDSLVHAMMPGGSHHNFYKEKLKRIGHFLKSIRDDQGRTIPILFRPFHEHNGWWFWWGSLTTTEKSFIDLWRFTVDYLRDSINVHNVLYVFSPDGHRIDTTSTYLYGYPGDDYVDVFGLDYYFGNGTSFEIERLRNRLHTITALAEEKGKVAAISEIGDRKDWDDIDALEIDGWHMDVVLNPIKQDTLSQRIAYLSTWRNESTTHHFAPYPGHKSVPDFLEFYGDTSTIFLNNMVKGITDSLYTHKLNELSDAAHIYAYTIQDSIHGIIQESDIFVDGTFVGDLKFRPEFGSSMNAVVSAGGVIQESGKTTVSLAVPTLYTVTAENKKTIRTYLVTLQSTTSNQPYIEYDNPLDIYPLPARSVLHVQSQRKISKLSIYGIGGQLVRVVSDNPGRKLTISLDGMVPADYVFHFQLENQKIQSRKITVH